MTLAAHRAKRQLRLPFLRSAPDGADAPVASFALDRTGRSLEFTQPRPRHPARRAAPAAAGAAAVLRGLRAARHVRRDPWKSADITAFGYMVNIAQGRTSWLRADGRRPARPTAPCCPTGSARPSSACSGRGSTPRWPRAFPSRCCSALVLALVWYATYSFARAEAAQPLPLAFGGEGDAGRLRAGHRRRRRARADRLARPAAARPRDHARTGAARQRRALPVRAGRAAAPTRAGPRRAADRAARAGGQRRAQHRRCCSAP